jgi:hypothetical protein
MLIICSHLPEVAVERAIDGGATIGAHLRVARAPASLLPRQRVVRQLLSTHRHRQRLAEAGGQSINPLPQTSCIRIFFLSPYITVVS